MPLPGESIQAIYKILDDAHTLMCIPASARKIDEERILIKKAEKLLIDEEMEIVRFGDVTRIADHTFEPYQTIKRTLKILQVHSNWVGAIKAREVLGAYLQAQQTAPNNQLLIF